MKENWELEIYFYCTHWANLAAIFLRRLTASDADSRVLIGAGTILDVTLVFLQTLIFVVGMLSKGKRKEKSYSRRNFGSR